jgi:hypothetical protein
MWGRNRQDGKIEEKENSEDAERNSPLQKRRKREKADLKIDWIRAKAPFGSRVSFCLEDRSTR